MSRAATRRNLDDGGGPGERVGDDAPVGEGQGGDGGAVGLGEEHAAGERRGGVEGGEIGERARVGVGRRAEGERGGGGHAQSVGTITVHVQRRSVKGIRKLR